MNYIAHHGIKGQKWGVRRFQNEDGSLTPAGQRRYARDVSKYERQMDRYERGRERYAKGQTMRNTQVAAGLMGLGTVAAASIAKSLIVAKGKDLVMKRGATTITAPAKTVGNKVALAILVGGGAAAMIFKERRMRDLKRYYAGKPVFTSKAIDDSNIRKG